MLVSGVARAGEVLSASASRALSEWAARLCIFMVRSLLVLPGAAACCAVLLGSVEITCSAKQEISIHEVGIKVRAD